MTSRKRKPLSIKEKLNILAVVDRNPEEEANRHSERTWTASVYCEYRGVEAERDRDERLGIRRRNKASPWSPPWGAGGGAIELASKERSEDDPVACASDLDDINEEFLSTGTDAPFAEFVSIDDNVPTCEPQSVAEIVAEVVGGGDAAEDEAPEDSGENESVLRPANFAEALAGLEALQSFFCTKNNENADKGLQYVQKELFLSK
ncbi:hypothetical protein MTO96_011483, partial [Rhipicephalus appendiculatus]